MNKLPPLPNTGTASSFLPSPLPLQPPGQNRSPRRVHSPRRPNISRPGPPRYWTLVKPGCRPRGLGATGRGHGSKLTATRDLVSTRASPPRFASHPPASGRAAPRGAAGHASLACDWPPCSQPEGSLHDSSADWPKHAGRAGVGRPFVLCASALRPPGARGPPARSSLTPTLLTHGRQGQRLPGLTLDQALCSLSPVSCPGFSPSQQLW